MSQWSVLWAPQDSSSAFSGLWVQSSALGVVLPSFHPISVPFRLGWWCFCWYNVLKNLVSLLWMSGGATPVNTSILHIFSLDNLVRRRITYFCWEGCLNLWVTVLVSLENGFPATPLALFPGHIIWKDWGFSKSSNVHYFFAKHFIVQLISSCILLQTARKTRSHLPVYLGNLSWISEVISYNFYSSFSCRKQYGQVLCHVTW